MKTTKGRRPSWSARILALLLGSGALLIGWGFWWEPGRLVVRDESLALSGWEYERPLRAVLIADLHVGSPRNGLDQLRRLVEKTNDLAPEVVLIAGDLVIDNVFGGTFVAPEEIAVELAALEAPLGVFAVLGNHDRWLSPERVKKALTDVGITVVENRAVRVAAPGAPFWVAGISDFWTGHPDLEGTLAQVDDDAPVLLVTHNPDLFPDVPDRVALTLAGHTHGGQVIIPFVGRAITPSRFGERYAVGHVVEEARHIFVSSGVGTSRLGVRFRVPPEVALLEISCASCVMPSQGDPGPGGP
ncbi:MAG: metallophosphoesterase [Gemmatimonadota bacterium]|nr:metallophosphoesterase [Gemmatimonadota bacterium]